MEKVTVAVTNYNGEHYLPECLDAIKALDYPELDILVVDNASTDGSVAYLKKHHPDVGILSLKENNGPGPARNAALQAAGSRLVFSLDNDAVVTPSCLRILVEALEKEPEAAIAEPRSFFYHQRDVIHYDGGLCNYIGLMHLRNFFAPKEKAPSDRTFVDSAIAVALLMDRDRVAQAGNYDESFFILYEDFDLSLRLRLMGYRIVHIPEAVVYHREGTAGISFRSGPYTSRRAFFHSRNRWVCLLKTYSLKSLLLTLPAHLLYELMWMAFLVPKGLLFEYFKGKGSLLRLLPVILKKRREFQARRKLPDREVLGYYGLTVSPWIKGRGAGIRLMDGFFSLYWKLIARLI